MENNFNSNSGSYLRTTENINGYYNKLDFKDKSVLTVVGSSDHIFEAVIRGASKIDGFDISNNSIMLYYLKEASVNALSYEEYMNFFFVEYTAFDKDTYERVRPYINDSALLFWDNVFNSQEMEPSEVVASMLASKRLLLYPSLAYAESKLSILSSHLSEDKYNILKARINNVDIRVFLRDVFDVDKVDKCYDYIFFSNIFEYHDSTKFKELIEEYKDKLSDDGILVAGYAYHDIDLADYQEYDIIPTESRWKVNTPDAPNDNLIVTSKKKLTR